MRLLVLLALVPLAGCLEPGCQDAVGVEDDHEVWTTCVAGVPRTTMAYVANDEAAVLVVLHSAGGSAHGMAETTRLHELAPPGFTVLFPQGSTLSRSDVGRTWNALHCCGYAHEADVDDVAFMVRLIEHVGVPVALVGHSNGGMLAHRVAAEHPDLVDVVVVVGGTIGGRTVSGGPLNVPMPAHAPHLEVLLVHARDDPEVPYAGGQGDPHPSGRVDLSVDASTEFWRNASANIEVVDTVGGHGWPGADDPRSPPDPDASALVLARIQQTVGARGARESA